MNKEQFAVVALGFDQDQSQQTILEQSIHHLPLLHFQFQHLNVQLVY